MKGRKGSALVTVLLTFTVLSILAVTLVTVISSRMRLAVSYADSTGALYAAQAGLEKMKLDIKNQVTSTAFLTNIHNYVQGQLTPNPGATDTQLSSWQRDATEQYLYTNYLKALTSSQLQSSNMLTQNSATYTILPFTNTSNQASNSFYDKANDRVIIRSKGTYGANNATKTVALTLQLSTSQDPNPYTDPGGSSGGGNVKWQDIPNYTALVSNTTPNQYSFKGYCESLTVNGEFYLPKGMDSILNGSSNFIADFNNSLVVNDDLNLASYAQKITVNKDMEVNGDLTLGPSSMQLIVENGDLIVNGNITIDGYADSISILKGSLRCNGNITFTGNGTASTISIAKDLHLKGTVTTSYNSHVQLTGGSNSHSYADYGGTITQQVVGTVNPSDFTDASIIKTHSINTNVDYGSKNNPVIIYSDNDLTINSPWDGNGDFTLNIYGMIYAKGKITITGFGGNSYFNMYGPMVSEKEIDINDYNMAVKFEYDGNQVMKNLISNYPNIISDVYSGFLSGSPTARNVYTTSGFTSTTWDE